MSSSHSVSYVTLDKKAVAALPSEGTDFSLVVTDAATSKGQAD